MKDGKPVPFILSYAAEQAMTMEPVDADHPKDLTPALQVPHQRARRSWRPTASRSSFIQACIAILILVGFESVTSMGEEAKNAKRDIPRAVLLSLGIQGIVCYLIEYFAANYFLNQGYTLANAGGVGRAARRHDGDRGHLALRLASAPDAPSCWCRRSRCSWPSSVRRSRACRPGRA